MLSIVIPVFNEEESLYAFYERLKPVVNALSHNHEIIFIDDGSTDKSLEILKGLLKKDKTIRIFSFRRNQGKAEALTLGFQKSTGEYIVTLDADLQDRPEEIEKLLSKAKEGYDIVSGWRKHRQDKANMKLISKLFNSIIGFMWGLYLHDYNCGLKVYIHDAAKSLRLYGGMHRFIPLIAYEEGFKVTEVAIVHDVRKFGKSKYGFSKIKDVPDMFTMLFLTKYGKRPLHFFGMIGGIILLCGMIILSYLWIIQLEGNSIGRRPLLFVGFFAVISGLQLIFTGFLADLMNHIAISANEEIVKLRLRYTTDKQKAVIL